MKRHLLIVFLLAGFAISTYAQEMTVAGRVTESENGEPIPGVSVRILSKNNRGTLTDLEGNYTLRTPGDETLVFSAIGFSSIEIPVNKQSKLDVALKPVISTLENVVVIGYGTQKKSQLTGAISSVRGDDVKDQPVSNLAASLQGRVSGMNVVNPSGTPGAGLLVSIRGYNAPLYVIDGIPQLAESNSALSTSFDLDGNNVGQGQTTSSISDINPNDIESVEILKDAAASAIYGARAANGVVLITTKRGKQGRPEANFNYYTGMQRVARPIKFMNAQQLTDLVQEARANDLALYNKDKDYFGKDFDPSVLTQPLENFDLAQSANTNWLDAVTQVAPISNYEMSFRSGTNDTRYYTSVGFYDQQGVVINNFYRRLTYKLNLDHNLTDKFIIGTTINFAYSKNRRSFNDNTYTGIITNALGASPFMPIKESDGSYADYTNYQSSWLSDNPVKSANEIQAYTNNYRVLATGYGQYEFNKFLKAKTSWSTDATFLYDNQFKSALTNDAAAVGGEAIDAAFRNITWLNENTLNYTRAFGKNNVSALVGTTFQHTDIKKNYANGQGFPAGISDIGSASRTRVFPVQTPSFGLISYIGRVNYDFENRYFVTATVRADGSSRFSKTNQYGYFPAVAAAWRISDESFFSGLKNIFTDAKVRLSYGLSGDQEIGSFQNQSYYRASAYDGQAGFQLRNISDPNLTWQINRSFNFGLDYEIKGGRFNGALEVFQSRKTRLLSEDAIAGTTGFATVTRNSGEVQNIGVEANINAQILRGSALKWTVNFNTTFAQNKIISLTTDDILLNAYSDLEATHILKIGQPVGSFYGLKFTGIDSQTGDATFEDTNGDGVTDYNDAQVIGKALPSVFGGLTNTLSYKGLDLNIFCRYSVGNQVYNLIRATTENLGWSNEGGLSSIYANNTTDVLNRWKQPGDNTEYGRASFVNQNAYQNSSQFVENGSFLRLQNVTLGYTFRNIKGIAGIRVFVEGQNLAILTRYKGFDPEVSSNGGLSDRTAGLDYGAYPSARTVLVGVNLKF
ncbi:MAG: TonB-dependent receptor [Saprospiraceae bacterium]|nr:TonB-dependent receptor [Saprospiraceae bacterium]